MPATPALRKVAANPKPADAQSKFQTSQGYSKSLSKTYVKTIRTCLFYFILFTKKVGAQLMSSIENLSPV